MAEFLKTRKRHREEDLPCESTPLPKRIKNEDCNSSSTPSLGCGDSNNYFLPTSGSGGGGGGETAVVTNPPVDEYDPELGPEENPHYYENNKILYDLHAERMKRKNQ